MLEAIERFSWKKVILVAIIAGTVSQLLPSTSRPVVDWVVPFGVAAIVLIWFALISLLRNDE